MDEPNKLPRSRPPALDLPEDDPPRQRTTGNLLTLWLTTVRGVLWLLGIVIVLGKLGGFYHFFFYNEDSAQKQIALASYTTVNYLCSFFLFYAVDQVLANLQRLIDRKY